VTFDYVIVGAGSAGCLLAERLSATGASVAIVEAGGATGIPTCTSRRGMRDPDASGLTWGYRTAPDAATGGRALDYPRGRVLGGSSAINGLGHVWGDPSDYDLWAQKGCSGWSWSDLAPHFAAYERAEERAGIAAGTGCSRSSTWRSCRRWWRGCAMPRPRSACRRRAT
jgi:choline dehydrogenase